MADATTFKGDKAVRLLHTVFRLLDADREYRVKFSNIKNSKTGEDSADLRAKITVAGFDENVRREKGKLDMLSSKDGCVSLYGREQPDNIIVLEHEGKSVVFPLTAKTTAQRSGIGETTVLISSPDWEKAETIEVFTQDVYEGEDALNFFMNRVVPKIHDGTITARQGKWVSKKSFDRSKMKVETDWLCINESIARPDADTLRTTHIGEDVSKVEFFPGNEEQNRQHTLKFTTGKTDYSLEFSDMIVEANIPGKEIGASKTKSSYVYLLGTGFSEKVNLVIIRHRPRQDKSGDEEEMV